MTRQEFNILDKNLKNVSLRQLITLIISTATTVASVLGVYYGFKTEQNIIKIQIKVLEERVNRLEKL